MKNILFILIVLYCLPVLSDEAAFMPGKVIPNDSKPEGITYNNDTGNYSIVYKTFSDDGGDMLFEQEFIPATKIKPKIDIKIQRKHVEHNRDSDFGISYIYEVENESKLQDIGNINFTVPGDTYVDQNSPHGWTPVFQNMPLNRNISNVGWYYSYDNAGRKRNKVEKFVFRGDYLPGFGTTELQGDTPVLAFAGEGPQGKPGDEFEALKKKNKISLISVIPVIKVSPELDLGDVLLGLKAHISSLAKDSYLGKFESDKIVSSIDAARDSIKKEEFYAAKDNIENAVNYIEEQIEDNSRHRENSDDSKKIRDYNRLEFHASEISLNNNVYLKYTAHRILIFDLKYIEEVLKKRFLNSNVEEHDNHHVNDKNNE